MLLAETLLCLAGLCCYVERTVLYTGVFVGIAGLRLTVRNVGEGKAAETGLLKSSLNALPPQTGLHCRRMRSALDVLRDVLWVSTVERVEPAIFKEENVNDPSVNSAIRSGRCV